MGLWSSIAGIAGNLLSGGISSAANWASSQAAFKQSVEANKQAQQRQYEYNLKLQQNQQQWSENLSSSAHQREVEDLRSAGLNPILSANGGASTPTSGMGSVGLTDDGQQAMNAFSSALQLKQLEMQKDLNQAQINKTDAETKNINIETVKRGIELERWHEYFGNQINELYEKAENLRKTASASQKSADASYSQAITAKEALELEKELAKFKKDLMKSEKEFNEANTKYTNERDRGYSFFNFDSYAKGFKGILKNLGIDTKDNPWR